MDLRAYLNEKRLMVDQALKEIYPEAQGPAAAVIEAMTYSLFAGGKRLRPILCVAAAEAVGGEGSDALPVACGLELIHTYSLIHDDLPAMDDDDLRRGKPTSHKAFGEAVALLAGDGLLTEAFRIMSSSEASKRFPPSTLLRIVCMIAEAAGYKGMVGGQTADILLEGKDLDPALVEFIHTHKTGALIGASAASGAILGGGNEDQVKAIASYGESIGLSFQIADDVLDIEGDTESLGKGVGGDTLKKKITYPAVHGITKSKQIEKALVEQAINYLEPFDHRADPLRQIAVYIIERKK